MASRSGLWGRVRVVAGVRIKDSNTARVRLKVRVSVVESDTHTRTCQCWGKEWFFFYLCANQDNIVCCRGGDSRDLPPLPQLLHIRSLVLTSSSLYPTNYSPLPVLHLVYPLFLPPFMIFPSPLRLIFSPLLFYSSSTSHLHHFLFS